MIRQFAFIVFMFIPLLSHSNTRWTFDGGIRNNSLAISPDETMAIASNSDSPEIIVYDLKKHKIIRMLTGYITPRNIIFSSHQDVFYISDSSQGFIDKIDRKSFKTIARYPVGYGAFGTAISPNGETMYVNNQAASSVTVLDLTDEQPKAVIQGFSQPRQGIKVSPDGLRTFVTNFMGDKISIINNQTNQIESEIHGFSKIRAISITSDGKTLFAANSGNNTISVVDLKSLKITHSIPVGKEPYGAALNPKGTVLYSGNLGDNSMSVIALPSMKVTATITGLEGPRQAIVFSKDGSLAYVLNEDLSIAIVDLHTNQVTMKIESSMSSAHKQKK